MLLPPVVTGLGPELRHIAGRQDDPVPVPVYAGPWDPPEVGAQRPEPGAVPVQLEVPPLVGHLVAIDGVAGMEELIIANALSSPVSLNEGIDLLGPGDQNPRA